MHELRKAAGTLAQMTASVYGLAFEPRMLTIRVSSTVTVRLQVSGQSSGQTLACSVFIGLDCAAPAGARQVGDWLGRQAKMRASHAAMSSTSASVTECGIGYSCHSTR